MNAYINGIAYYLPRNELTNADLSVLHPEWSIEKIAQKTGIHTRHIAAENELASDMAVQAINNLFQEISVEKSSIDFLLFCTQSPDFLLPTTACILQDKVGLPKTCGALDFNLGCSGYIYGLSIAKGLVESGQAKNVLLVTAETYSKHIHPMDKSNKTIFGDAAAATLITSQPDKNQFVAFLRSTSFGTDGSGYDKLIIKNSGLRRQDFKMETQYDDEGNFLSNDDFLYMDGKGIFNFTAFEVPPLIDRVLDANSLKREDIGMFIFHQANAYMLDFVRKRCQIPEEKFFVSMKDVGNTVSSTIPIALKRYIIENCPIEGTNLLLAGFGVGLSMGGMVITCQ